MFPETMTLSMRFVPPDAVVTSERMRKSTLDASETAAVEVVVKAD